MQAINELKNLVAEGFDEESVQSVLYLEQQLQEALQAEKLGEHPIIQKLITNWTAKQSEAQTKLLTNRNLTEAERHHLFDLIELIEEFISTFNGQNTRTLERLAEEYLSTARGGGN